MAQRVSRGIALLFHDRGTRRGWVVSSTPRPHFTPGKDPVPILQEAVLLLLLLLLLKKVKWSRCRPGVAQRVGRGIALLFHDCDTRRGWVVSSTPWPQFTPGKDVVPILQEAGWAPGPVWTGGKSRPNRDSIPDRPARHITCINQHDIV